jgi:hypothetical protein
VFDNPLILAKPDIDPIGELNALEDVDLILNLYDNIHDGDTNINDLTITENSSYATLDDFNITFNYPNEFNYPSGRDYEIVAINVSDSIHNVSQEVRVNVLAVNDPPLITGVPDIQVNESEYYYMDVTPYLSDIDNILDELTVTEISKYASVTGKNITFYYPKDSGIISEKVKIIVSDGDLNSSQNITVTVIKEGARFALLDIPDQNAIEDIDHVVDLSDFILIYDNLSLDDLTIEINSSHCNITGTELRFNYPNSFNYPSSRNYEIVQVNVSNQEQIESREFRINVQPVNDGPVLTVVEAPEAGLTNEILKFVVEYLDIDGGEEPIVKVVFENTDYLLNFSTGNIHTVGAIYNTELELPAGDYEYYYLADDGESEANSVFKTSSYSLKVLEYSEYGTDTDSDSIPDAWELQFGLDPFDPLDAALDPDNDNYTNLEEFFGDDGIAGGGDSTDPNNELDFPSTEQTGKDGKDDDDKNKIDDASSKYFNWLVIAIVIIIVVIILVILLLMKRTKKTGVEDSEYEHPPSDYPEPTEETQEESLEESLKEPTEEPTEELPEESIEEPSEETPEESTEELIEEPPEEPEDETITQEPDVTDEELGKSTLDGEEVIEEQLEDDVTEEKFEKQLEIE